MRSRVTVAAVLARPPTALWIGHGGSPSEGPVRPSGVGQFYMSRTGDYGKINPPPDLEGGSSASVKNGSIPLDNQQHSVRPAKGNTSIKRQKDQRLNQQNTNFVTETQNNLKRKGTVRRKTCCPSPDVSTVARPVYELEFQLPLALRTETLTDVLDHRPIPT